MSLKPPTPEAVSALLRVAGSPDGVRQIPQLLATPLVREPGPWSLWVLVALARHVPRQEWVAAVARERLGADPSLVGRAGAFGHPEKIPQRGVVPGLSEWEYFFHGCGCCLTHRIDGTSIDVDFDDDGGAAGVDPFFYQEFLHSLKQPALPERLLKADKPLADAWQADIGELRDSGLLDDSRRVRVTPRGSELVEALAPVVNRLTDLTPAEGPTAPPEAAVLAAGLGDAVLAESLLSAADGRTSPADGVSDAVAAQLRTAAGRAHRERAEALAAVISSPRAAPLSASIHLQALARLGRQFAEPIVLRLLGSASAKAPASTALQIAASWSDPTLDDTLLDAAERCRGDNAPYQRLHAGRAVARRMRAAADPSRRRRVIALLESDLGYGDGEAGLVLATLDPEAGLRKLRHALASRIPGARNDAAAALVVIGTDSAERVLLEALSRSDDFDSTLEVRAALMEWPDPAAWDAVRQWEARHPAPPPEGHTTDIGGVVRPVYSMAEVHRNSAAGFTRYSIEKFREAYGGLLARA